MRLSNTLVADKKDFISSHTSHRSLHIGAMVVAYKRYQTYLAIRLNAVLEAVELPTRIADLRKFGVNMTTCQPNAADRACPFFLPPPHNGPVKEAGGHRSTKTPPKANQKHT